MVRSAAALFREQGYSGTGFRDVISHSGAPWGSIYHHFPGGKAELAQEVVRQSGDVITAIIESGARADEPIGTLRLFIDSWKRGLEASDYRAGCPVVAVATEAHDEAPELADAAANAFAGWEAALAAKLRQGGIGRARAQRLATLIVAASEGAIVLCRARRDTRPLDDVGRELEASIRAALPGRADSRSRR